MEIQEIFYEMLTPAQRLRIQKAKAIAAKFVEFKAYCEQNDVAVNTEGFCRAMGKEYKYSTLAIRRMLEREGVLTTTKRDDNGKSSKDTENGIADRSLSTGNGSSIDGNCEMHAV
jgi:hypothetical protein